jgi:hypothetical protein
MSTVKKVEIVGLDRLSIATYVPTPGWDVWTLNVWYEGHWPLVIPDRVFQLHKKILPVMNAVKYLDVDRIHAHFAEWGVQVWTIPDSIPQFPECEAVGNLHSIDPEELYAMFPEEPPAFLFSSSIPYMLAQAAKEGYKNIRVRACPMRDEYRFELAGTWRIIQLLEEKYGVRTEVQYGDEWAEIITAYPELLDEERTRLSKQGLCYIDFVGSVVDHRYVTPTLDLEWQEKKRQMLLKRLAPEMKEQRLRRRAERLVRLAK